MDSLIYGVNSEEKRGDRDVRAEYIASAAQGKVAFPSHFKEKGPRNGFPP